MNYLLKLEIDIRKAKEYNLIDNKYQLNSKTININIYRKVNKWITLLKNFLDKIKEMTGKSLDEITELYLKSNLTKHSEVREFFMNHLKLSCGYANTLVHIIMKSDGTSLAEGKSMEEVLNDIYSDKKSHFRPIHDLIIGKILTFGELEIIPKKGYVSLKHKKQFAMIGPKTNTRMEIGINLTDFNETSRLIQQPKGSMCKFIVKLSSIEEVDTELINWIHEAYIQTNS